MPRDRVIELGSHAGKWCSIGEHDACTGTWQQVPCSCSCHVGDHTIDLINSRVDLTVGDRQALLAFAAFLRYAGARYPRRAAPGEPVPEQARIPLNKPWHDWLTGNGPTPDPDSEVGPEPWTEREQCGGNHG